MLLIVTALFLGFVHGLGADHLMGIAALSLAPAGGEAASPRVRALGIALRFAIGHALLLGLGAGALILFGWSLPVLVERGGEVLGGVLLIALGAAGLWGVLSGRVYAHSHRHSGEQMAHWHLHVGAPTAHPAPASHSHLPTIIGAAFAISSLRALTLLAPFGGDVSGTSLPVLLALIGVFALGILISMSLFGVAFASVVTAPVIVRLGRVSGLILAVASISLGGYWIATAF